MCKLYAMPNSSALLDGAQTANRVTLSVATPLPEFNPSDPEIWFTMVELQFTSESVSDHAKRYLSVLKALPRRYSSEVRDIIVQPVDDHSYERLKEGLIKRLSTSQEEKTKQLLQQEQMGDDKPSHFLRRLQNLAGTAIPDTLVRAIWQSRLPTEIQTTVAISSSNTLQEAAEIADRVFDIVSSRLTIATASSSASSDMHKLAIDVQRLLVRLDAIDDRLSKLEQLGARARSPSRPPQHSRPRQHSRSRTPQHSDMCWYHLRFADAATSCSAPCNWSSENDAGNR